MDLEKFPTSPAAIRMIGYVSTEFYERSYVAKWLYQVMGLEWDEAVKCVEELPLQFFPETATWGLFYHEMKYHLPIRKSLSYEERRRFIFAKRDMKRPMNPYYMEQSLLPIISGEADVIDSCEDRSIPPNTFVVRLSEVESEEAMKGVRAFLDGAKQSHTTYTILFHDTAEAREYFYVGYVAELTEDSCEAYAY